VALECRQPVGIVTKNALVLRDLDVLAQMASLNLVHVFLSINSLRSDLARDMEPRTSTPAARLRAVGELAQNNIPVGVMVAPIIPGLNDQEIPAVLAEAQNAGAQTASYILLRLPLTVEPVFREWLTRTHPNQQQKILNRQREMHSGKLNNSQWGTRMRGSGEQAEQIKNLFHVFAAKHQLDRKLPPQNCDHFRRPDAASG